ncbi:zinc finger domain-containing protein [Streptomyces katrae]|uniref:zinc finger domain-containing protein n=1 Tax=Streptomyces katrae TaxID=68223 RepID=UPI003B5B203D
MSRAVPPAVRERARSRSCPPCRARPGEKCAPDRAGRSQLHRGRIRDAQQPMEPLPTFRILPRDEDRVFRELQP